MRPTALTAMRTTPRREWHLRWLALLIATAMLAGTAGYAAGSARSNAQVITGTAYSGDGRVAADADGRAYAIPLDQLYWVDSRGSLHSNGRPECLPSTGQTGPVKFAAVEVTVEGLRWRPVVWVSCRS